MPEPEKKEPTSPPSPPAPSPPSPPTPTPTPQPPVQPTKPGELTAEDKDRLLTTYTTTIRDQGRALNEAHTQMQALADRVKALEAPPKPTAQEDAQTLLTDPRKLIREELSETVKPLVDFVSEFRSGSAYDRIKASLKNDPRFKPAFDHGEGIIDAAINASVQKGVQLTEGLVQSTALGVIGAIATGQFPGVDPRVLYRGDTTPPAPGAPLVTPPHISPSPPPPPAPASPAGPGRDPTELERRIMREQGFKTFEEYIAWVNMPSGDVAQSTHGRA